MKPKTFYLILCVVGLVLPTWQFSFFFLESGFDFVLFLQQPFGTRVGTALVFDLAVAVFAFFAFAVVDALVNTNTMKISGRENEGLKIVSGKT